GWSITKVARALRHVESDADDAGTGNEPRRRICWRYLGDRDRRIQRGQRRILYGCARLGCRAATRRLADEGGRHDSPAFSDRHAAGDSDRAVDGTLTAVWPVDDVSSGNRLCRA